MTLFEELKRRRVVRVAMVYGVTAWIITEVSATVLPALRLSEDLVTVIVVLLIAGFPIAMVLAWIFDINQGEISRTESSEQPTTNRVLYGGLLLVTTVALAGFFYWRLPSSEPVAMNSIAVLPFTNLSSSADSDYFSDGMSEELLNLLAKIPGLNVAARTSSFAFKNQDVDIRTIARELGVATVLEGSVRWSEDGERVRITAQLIDASDGYHLWSDTFDRELEDIFMVQDEIASAIVQSLQLQLATEETDETTAALPAVVPPTSDTQAYTDYLEGRSLWRQRGAEQIRRSIDLFQSAIGRDPGFARAHSNLAAAYVVLPNYTGIDREEPYAMALESAMQAIAIEPNLAEAYAVLAQVSVGEWDWKVAEANFFFATSLDASEPLSHYWYAQHLARVGRGADALVEARLAAELDPGSAVMQAGLAYILDQTGDREGAIAAAERAASLGFEGGAELLIAEFHLRAGEFTQAYEVLKNAQGVHPETLKHFETTALAAQGATDVPLDTTRGPEMGAHALIRAVATKPEDFIEVARTLAANRTLPIEGLWGKSARPLLESPGFIELLRDHGLMDYWRRYGWPDVCGEATPAALCG